MSDQDDEAAMYACPRWQKCNANVCPLDPQWRLRTHGHGDQICFYLLEAVKPGAAARFQVCGAQEMLSGVLRPLPELSSRWSAIERAVERAKTTGSRLDRVAPGRERPTSPAPQPYLAHEPETA
jgi:hypothetical protein